MKKHLRQVVEGSGLASLILEYPQGAEPGTIAIWLNESYGTEFTRAHIEGFLLRARKKGYHAAMLRVDIAETEHVLSTSIDTLDDILEDLKTPGNITPFNKDKAQLTINTILAMSKLIKEKRSYLRENLKETERKDNAGDEGLDLTQYPPVVCDDELAPPLLHPDSLQEDNKPLVNRNEVRVTSNLQKL